METSPWLPANSETILVKYSKSSGSTHPNDFTDAVHRNLWETEGKFLSGHLPLPEHPGTPREIPARPWSPFFDDGEMQTAQASEVTQDFTLETGPAEDSATRYLARAQEHTKDQGRHAHGRHQFHMRSKQRNRPEKYGH